MDNKLGQTKDYMMTHVEYFKLQAKNLFRDFKGKSPKHFPYDAEFVALIEYGYDEEDFSLMKAQHIIALMGGCDKWTDLIKAPAIEQELAKLLFDNHKTIIVEDWLMYLAGVERDAEVLDAETKLQILKQVWLR